MVMRKRSPCIAIRTRLTISTVVLRIVLPHSSLKLVSETRDDIPIDVQRDTVPILSVSKFAIPIGRVLLFQYYNNQRHHKWKRTFCLVRSCSNLASSFPSSSFVNVDFGRLIWSYHAIARRPLQNNQTGEFADEQSCKRIS